MLLNMRNAYLSDLQEFLEDDLFEQEKEHLQQQNLQFREKASLMAADRYARTRMQKSLKDSQLKIDRLLIQQSLGTHIKSFKTIEKDETIGFAIELEDGDICSEELQISYSSTIEYLCDPAAKSGRPELQYSGDVARRAEAADCHFTFVHRSMHACPVCKRDQVEVIKH